MASPSDLLEVAYLKYCNGLATACKARGVDSTGFIPYMTENGANVMTSCSVCRLSFSSLSKTVKRHLICDKHIDNIAACLRVSPDSFKGDGLACPRCNQQFSGNRKDSLKRHEKICQVNRDTIGHLPSHSYTTHDIPDRVSRQGPIKRSASLPIPTNSYAEQSSQHHYYNNVQAAPATYNFDPFSAQSLNWH